jgi:hypothetical protein
MLDNGHLKCLPAFRLFFPPSMALATLLPNDFIYRFAGFSIEQEILISTKGKDPGGQSEVTHGVLVWGYLALSGIH